MDNLETSTELKIMPKYFILAIIISIGNIVFFDNYYVSLVMVGIEIIILLYFLMKGDLTEYICCYLIFLAPCIEFGGFVSNDVDSYFYGFKNFRIMGFNLALIFIIIPFVYIILTKKIKIDVLKRYRNSITLIKYIFFLIFSATIMGLVNISLNDNSIRNFPRYLVKFFEQAYENYWIIMVVLVTFIAVVSNGKKNDKIENSLIAILFSSVVALQYSAIVGIHGSYGTLATLLAPTVSWFIPFLIVLSCYERYKSIRVILLIAAIAGNSVLLLNNSNGKIILFFVINIITALVLFVKKNILLRFFPFVLICILMLSFSNIFIEKFTNDNQLLKSKYEQVIGLVSVWNDDWLENMPTSPKFRITEFLNTGIEYTHKPWQFIFGKGYLGTIRDYLNSFGWNVEGAFTIDQYGYGIFYALHETINELFLKNGLAGLVILLLILKRTIFNSQTNIWLLIGGTWFGLFFGFSLTLSVFGIISLVLGLVQLDLDTARVTVDSNECSISNRYGTSQNRLTIRNNRQGNELNSRYNYDS